MSKTSEDISNMQQQMPRETQKIKAILQLQNFEKMSQEVAKS